MRDPDHLSKRGVPYWWSPEWRRGSNGEGMIKALKERTCHNIHKNACQCPYTVNLYMVSQSGNQTYIQGSIQVEFKRWHEDRQIDYMLLGIDPDEIIE